MWSVQNISATFRLKILSSSQLKSSQDGAVAEVVGI
jgi:hypothetical protein